MKRVIACVAAGLLCVVGAVSAGDAMVTVTSDSGGLGVGDSFAPSTAVNGVTGGTVPSRLSVQTAALASVRGAGVIGPVRVPITEQQVDVVERAASATGDSVQPAIQGLADSLGVELPGLDLRVSHLSVPNREMAVESLNRFADEAVANGQGMKLLKSPTFQAVRSLIASGNGSILISSE